MRPEEMRQLFLQVSVRFGEDTVIGCAEGCEGEDISVANDICKESKRQTMNADDVLKAIEEIDFAEFLGPLKATLEGMKRHREMIQSDSYQQLEYLVVA
ncbi:hypothetical protein QQ045_028172 [Rhodiola kirilowii]